ncbi:RNA-directed DNA polymerase, eukaryota, partial [Tanacetum coccineum]
MTNILEVCKEWTLAINLIIAHRRPLLFKTIKAGDQNASTNRESTGDDYPLTSNSTETSPLSNTNEFTFQQEDSGQRSVTEEDDDERTPVTSSPEVQLTSSEVGTSSSPTHMKQSAFVANRLILDGPFILNELLSWCKHKKSKVFIFKIDFEKAFDSVRWDYLDMVMHNFGFGSKWRCWIQGCLKSAKGSILVNGSPTAEFEFFKGLKQGDPLSPFLFILIMESLHISFKNVISAGLFNGIRIDSSFNLSHLFYADDVIFVGKWELSNLSTVVKVLKWFHVASGLKINLSKSKLMGIGISNDAVVSAARSIGCAVLQTPFNYLGVKVGAPMTRLGSWNDVVNKLSVRLSKWKLKSLSIGGRLTLIKSILSSL